MTHLNLSEWGLRHRSMIAYLIIVMVVGGVFSYFKLGRAEDPDFTFKAMVVRTLWPGATAQEVEQQVTERIEKKLQEVPWADVIRSNSKSGESLVFIILKDYTPKKEVPEAWYQVRKKLGDIRHTLPAGVQGPFFNDEFGDTFTNIFALTGDGFDLAELRREADRIARELRAVPDVKKIELIGVQDEKIYVELAQAKLAALGVDPALIFDALQKQNAMAPSGFFETASDRVRLRVSQQFNWQPNGPIQRYIEEQGIGDFFDAHSDEEGHEEILFGHGMLSNDSVHAMRTVLKKCQQQMAQAHRQSLPVPQSQKRGMAMVLALRTWEPKWFRQLRRVEKQIDK